MRNLRRFAKVSDNEQAMIESEDCEHCDSQAQFIASSLYLFRDHHDDYL